MSSTHGVGVSPAEHSMYSAESNLAHDAPWKKIQKNTFTRWCNEHLRCVDREIQDLQFDLNDGLTLIALLEVLSHKKMLRKYHTRPTFRQMRLDNVSVALEFLEQENIKLVSIDSKAIVDGNMKLILGLVWTLILHYSISSPLLGDGVLDKTRKQTPELRLLGWIQDKVPELPITNFSQDWMSGKALGALVDGLAPGLCPDWESWDEVQRVDNAREAMQQADEWLGVPQVIAPEEIIDPRVDEQSIMTYLSMFPKAQLKQGAPLKPKSVSKPKACRASGRGLQQKGLRVGQAVDFRVDISRAGPGDLKVHVTGPESSDVPVQLREENDDMYALQYQPTAVGRHTVDITWGGEHILKSPFEVSVGPSGAPQAVRAWGPGLQEGVVGMSADFVVESVGADPGMLGFAIEGPSQARIECADRDDGSCDVRFWPTEPGEYAVHVTCDEEDIQDSPFMPHISPKKKACYPHKVKVFGPGVSETGFIQNCAIEFTVDARFAGDGTLGLLAQSCDGRGVSVELVRKENGVYTCSYTATTAGKHTIFVSWGGVGVPGSPFRVMPARVRIEPSISTQTNKSKRLGIHGDGNDQDLADSPEFLDKLDLNVTSPTKLPSDATKVEAYGSGLHGGVVGILSEFTIDTNSCGSGQLSVTVDGPRPVQMKCLDNKDATCTVTYLPTECGTHVINILFQRLHIPGSPFQAHVHMPFDHSKVVVSGPGLTTATVGQPCVVNIDCSLAGFGELSAEAVSESGHRAKTKIKENSDGTYTVVYVPLTTGVYTLRLRYGGKTLANFPSKVVVGPAVYTSQVKICGRGVDGEDLNDFEGQREPTKVTASGIGLLHGVAGHNNSFSVTNRSDGAGLEIHVVGPSDAMASYVKKQDGCYDVQYNPSVPGVYNINITSEGQHILGSPFTVPVKDPSDVRDVKVSGSGLKMGACAQLPQTFTVNSSKTGEAPESIAVITPTGKMEHLKVKDNGDGTYSVAYCPSMEGAHSLVVKYADEEEICCPFPFQVLPKHPSRKLNISVPGLESGVCAQTLQTFTIDGKNGEAPESVAIVTPSGEMQLVELTDNGDGTYAVAYCPSIEGNHSVMVKYADEEEFCSFSDFQVLPTNDSKTLKVSGSGLESGLCSKVPQTFTINCSETGEPPETVAVMTPGGKMEIMEVMDNGNGTYSMAFSPSIKGDHSLLVKYSNEDKFCSPLPFQVVPSDTCKKLNISVPGLESGVCVQIPQTFTLDSKTGEAPESVAIMTPSGQMEHLKVKDNGDGTYSVAYSPSMEGDHSLVVKYADEDEFCSPFPFQVVPSDFTRNLNISVPGLESGVCAQIPQTFTIDSKNGEAPESVAIMTPSGEMQLVEVTDNRDGTYAVAYCPSIEGDHSVMVKYADEDEFCSPYNFHVISANEAINLKHSTGAGLDSRVCAKVPQKFTIGCSKSGEAPESVAMLLPNGKLKLVEVTDNGNGTYSVVYSPSVEGAHSLVVKYADEDEFCSPLQCPLLSCHDASKVQASGPGLTSGLPASIPAQFLVDTSDAGEGELTVRIIDPDGRERRRSINDLHDGTYEVSYVPDKAGGYQIIITYGGDEIPTSPYHVWVIATGDADKCIVTGPGLGSVISAGEEICFLVNTRSAGMGKVSCFVLTPDGTEAEADVMEREDGTFEICYAASQPGNYIVSAGFGGECLFTSTFEVMAPDNVLDPEQFRQTSILKQKASPPRDSVQPSVMHGSYIPLSRVNPSGLMPFDIVMAFGVPKAKIRGEVCMPSGSMAHTEVVDNGDGTVTLMYGPTEEGLHLMHITVNGSTIVESPLQFYVNNASNNDLMAHGPGLVFGTSNKTAFFTIFNKDLAVGELDIALEGPSKADVHCLNNRDGSCTVTYLPTVPGHYTILVRHNDLHILGSPFKARITASCPSPVTGSGGESPCRSQVKMGTEADISLDISEEDISLLTASVVSPSGQGVSCLLKRQPDSHIGISFIPKEVGEHLVSVMKDGEHVANSPIPLNITPVEIADASRVKVFGMGIAKGHTCEMSDFVVDTRRAGYGGLTLGIEGPSNVEIQTEELEDGTCGVSFRPTEPGIYTVSVQFADEHVPGSPFRTEITDSGRVTESITHYQEAATITNVGNKCGINLKIPGLDAQHVSAQVSSPSGALKDATVSTKGNDIYTLSFVPSETGVHGVVVLHRGQPIPGSSLQYTVGLLGEGGPEKVHAWGHGLQSAEASVPADFSIWAHEAGAGNLSVTMEGSGRAELVFEDRGNGSCGISYIAPEPGDYEVSMKFNNEHIPDSPYLVPVYAPADNAFGKNKSTGPQMRRSTSRCDASFLWSSFVSDASKVVGSGPGLRQAFQGRRSAFSVDCSKAGTNLLLVGMHGPTVPCEEVSIKHLGNNHYEVSYIITEKGSYVLAVKWGEEHIPGSPFLVTVP